MRMEEYVIKNQKKLRLGITTGTCSAAAARAAAMQLLLGVESHAVTLRTPKGMTVSVPVYLLEADADRVSYKVVKDSGDDPDVTNGTDVCCVVACSPVVVCSPVGDGVAPFATTTLVDGDA